ncbi:Peptidase aspartic, catalytic; UBA-like [Ectocarpus siliculosus]|uniref:Peptidase aspartic, catalytic UBA-like n=1 Tax=Ectocarpus siliculosus TaxID=2880 RepID=D8LQW7_ECTSI|nr:Peptidase aspartic, catalytic; UBA-like [Ectocarpus siliculosus]|eukprot:CBN77640.1 Peptidase aspartic, catalytic; UBA-like [Ectocarpus siliculosus]
MATQAPSIRRAKDGAQHSLPSAPTDGAAAATTKVPMTRQRHSNTRGWGWRRCPVFSTTTTIRALRLAVALLALAGRLVPAQGAGGDLGPRSEWQHPRSRGRRGNKAGGDGSGRGRREARRGYAGAFPCRERSEREGAVASEGEAGGGWSRRRKGSESMREIVELAKADARAVRAAGQRQNEDAAAATAAEAEAAWAAAGVGSGGSVGDNAMLFLECEVNGRVLRAFVDTGAQVTVMSAACAERCGLASRIDKSYAGRAVGVGFARILGRIHDASIRIGNSCLRCSLTVIEHGEIDLLVGLDVLRAHRCEISLSKNRMKFHAGDGPAKEVAFLTRIEREGGRCQRRRHRPRRRSSGVGRGADRYGYADDNDGCSYSSEEGASRSYGAPGAPPPPRVLREMARGTRGDGTPSGMEKRPSQHSSSMEDSDDGGGGGDGIGGPSQSVWPKKRMRGWPPRGGEEELETAENHREEREGRHEGKADSRRPGRRGRRWHQSSGLEGGHTY